MQKQKPLVSVSMITFHAQDFISEAIEGVLNQQVDFPIELVIGDDSSQDQTRAICEAYAAKHPEIIRVLPHEKNMGIAANTARTMGKCTGKYIAVCDGDDVWTDPLKLKKQVNFLENHPDYGVVYSDVVTISDSGAYIGDPDQDNIRKMYQTGSVFLDLLQANFINNSTAVFRREYLHGHEVFPDRSYQIPDYLRWLHIATRSKVHFINEKTTAYRRHDNGLSLNVPKTLARGNWRAYQRSLFRILPEFDRYNDRKLCLHEKKLIFRKLLSLIWRPAGSLRMKWQVVQLLPKYFPGMEYCLSLGSKKVLDIIPEPVRHNLTVNFYITSNVAPITRLESITLLLQEQLIISL